jgi:hypothetical protein
VDELNGSEASEAAMQEIRFEAFGEPVKYDKSPVAAPDGPISSWLTLAGTGLFWSLVAVIVVARAVYFVPDLAGKFWQLEALGRTVRTVIGA